MAAANALDPNELFAHVQDAPDFHVPRFMSPHGDGLILLPQPLATVKTDADGQPVLDHHGHPTYEPIWAAHTRSAGLNQTIQPLDLKVTKFMVIEAIVALVLWLV